MNLSDLRLALRSLRQHPGLFGAVVLTIALGLAANASLFAIFDGLLFRPLPFYDADQLVHIQLPPAASAQPMPASERQAVTEALAATPLLQTRTRVVETVMLFEEGAAVTTDWNLRAAQVTPEFFPMLGVLAAHGRVLQEVDRRTVPARPVLLGHALWRARFGGDPGVVGTIVPIEGALFDRPLEIAGVMPEGFAFPSGANVWVLPLPSLHSHPVVDLPSHARLAPGVTIAQLRNQFPRAVITPLREHTAPRGSHAFAFLLAGTGILLLVAWVQVAALLFTRTVGRAREIGTQLALGATRGRLIRQFTSEGAVVTLMALALGWLAAPALNAFIVNLLPPEMTAGLPLQPDWRAFAFAAALSVLGVGVLALLPLHLVRRASALDLMRGNATGAWGQPSRVRSGMLALQIGLSAALLYVAGLALQSFSNVSSVDPGFDAARLVVFRVPNPTVRTGAGQAPPAEQFAIWRGHVQAAIDAARALPGVEAVSAGGTHPLRPAGGKSAIVLQGSPADDAISSHITLVEPGYFEALGIDLLEGRSFDATDQRNQPGVIINAALARALGISGAALGRRVMLDPARRERTQQLQVVGVVGNAIDERPDVPPEPRLYRINPSMPYVIVRTAGDPHALVPVLRTAVQGAWHGLPARNVVVLEDELRRASADYRARGIVLAVISLLCLPLAIAGIIGALNYDTRLRMREIAIRLALGAEPGRIRSGLVNSTLLTVAAALVGGTLIGMTIARLASQYLFGVQAASPWIMAGVWIVLLATAWLAAILPAARASRIEPAATLRE